MSWIPHTVQNHPVKIGTFRNIYGWVNCSAQRAPTYTTLYRNWWQVYKTLAGKEKTMCKYAD